jgi:hypothetical protein
MASNPVLHEATQNGIRWCVIRRLDLPEPGCVTFQKWGKHDRPLLCQVARLDAEQGTWAMGFFRPTPPRVPKYLTAKVEAAMVKEFAATPEPAPSPRPMPGSPPVPVPVPVRRIVPNASEAVSVGRMSFHSFLAMELIEAYHPDLYRRHTAQAH